MYNKSLQQIKVGEVWALGSIYICYKTETKAKFKTVFNVALLDLTIVQAFGRFRLKAWY